MVDLFPARRVPGTKALDYLSLVGLRFVSDDRSVAAVLKQGALAQRLVEPLAIAALNTQPDTGLARLLGAVVRETLMQGGAACIPRFPRISLADSLIDPAVAALRAGGGAIHFSRRIAGLEIVGNRIVSLLTPDGPIPLGKNDSVVLAVPPWVAADLLPGLLAPDAFEAILNIHFRAEADPGEAGFIGLVGGTAEWAFVKPGHVSVTVSAANRLVDLPAEDIAAAVWPDVRTALGLPWEMPAFRVVKEKRATFAATAGQDRKRPKARTGLVNLALGRRLDRHRVARDHRRCDQIRGRRGPDHPGDLTMQADTAEQDTGDIEAAVARALAALGRRQNADGHWVFPLEADATIPAEYVLLEHFLDRIDQPLQERIGVYLRATQGAHGGWPLFHDGAFNLSASVKAYFALKAIGDPPDAPHMARARAAILAAGGAERTNVFTRAQLALFGEVPWRAVPVMPMEIMHLPLWFPFHLSKVSYWSRTVIVPLLVLMALKPRARNPRGVGIAELFATPPEQVRD